MAKLKKTYKFALITAGLIAVLTAFVVGIILFFLNCFNISTILVITFSVFFCAVFIVQYQAEHFIYKRVKQLYDDLNILDNNKLSKQNVTTNIEELRKSIVDSVEEYVDSKQIEIADLTEKESFRKEYIGNIAHELKTPLFTVQGYILTLIDGAWQDNEICEKYLNRANKGIERLSSIVKDLDMITKLETEGMKLNIEKINIVELVQSVFDLLEMRAKKRGISLSFDKVYTPIFVQADKERLEQVLINLIVNSIKYGKINGKTTIKIENYSNSQKIIRVIDNGEGIDNIHKNRLFERFYRVDRSRSRKQGGSGLGLAIVKHIIEAHNQKIMLDSVYGKGSEFSFTLKKA